MPKIEPAQFVYNEAELARAKRNREIIKHNMFTSYYRTEECFRGLPYGALLPRMQRNKPSLKEAISFDDVFKVIE